MIRQTAGRRLAVLAFELALLCVAAAPLALADDTILRLSETATVLVPPDELTATLRAEATAPTAQDAQRKVNEMMKDALATAKAVDGMRVATGAYNVWRFGPPAERAERWQASQILNLTGKDPEAMQRLVGDLQQKGLAQSALGWRLSTEAERKAREQATRTAISRLRGRADDAAEVLGLRFASFKDVTLDSVMPPPIMQRQAVAGRAMLSSSAPPPSVEAEDVPVNATAEADVVLKPR